MVMIGDRLMVVGVLFLLVAGGYWVAQSPTETEIQSERFYQRLSTGYEPSTNAVRQQFQAKAKGALWPAGIGVILLGVGWAMSSGSKPAAPVQAPEVPKQDQDAST